MARRCLFTGSIPRCVPWTKAIAVLVVLCLAACFAHSASAQKEIVAISDWRVHEGDNPEWARPDFDDSGWAQANYSELTSRSDSSSGTRWCRATFEVPADFAGQELAVGVGPIDEVYDLYVEGILVGRFGNWTPKPEAPFPRHLAFPIPQGLLKGPVGHIAIRRWKGAVGLGWLVFALAGNISSAHAPEIGSRGAIEAREQLHPAAGAIQQLPWLLTDCLFLFAAAISIVLFSVQRHRPEYLYLGVYCLLVGVPPFIGAAFATNNSVMARSWGPVLTFLVYGLDNTFSLLFLASLCLRFRRVLQFGALLTAVFALAHAYSFAEQSHAIEVFWMYGHPYTLVVFELIAMWGLFQDRRRGSLAIAACLLVDAFTWGWGIMTIQLRLAGRVVEAGPFRIDVRSVPGIMFVFVTLLVLYLRYRDERLRQEATDQDLAAARRMQEQLLAGSEKNPPGFTVDAVYRPACEVGGDFYRTVSLEDGSLLVIVGDVSGKGLDAAMLVAMVLGSLANETHRSPASLLAYLNKAVIGRTGGGFITACCARFCPDGRVVLANAGQISPYVEGRELQLETGLPLGISPESNYCECEIQADRSVTFLSDGVLEACNAKGELLGFERMAALTTKSAVEIAEAAQRWGQEDDITVLKLRRDNSVISDQWTRDQFTVRSS